MSDSVKVVVNLNAKASKNELLLSPLILINLLNETSLAQKISIQFQSESNQDSTSSSVSIQTANNPSSSSSSAIQSTSELATQFASFNLLGSDSNQSKQISSFLSTADSLSNTTDIQTISSILDELDNHFNLRTYLANKGHQITAADVAIYAALKSNVKSLGLIKQGRENLRRWLDHLYRLEPVIKADKDLKEAIQKEKDAQKGGAEKVSHWSFSLILSFLFEKHINLSTVNPELARSDNLQRAAVSR